jgi:hypothetical protein
MKRTISASIIAAVLGLAGCVTYPQYPRLNVDISAVRYNDIASTNFAYPLVVEHTDKMLILKAQEYTSMPSQFMIDKKIIPDFLSAIDKYLEWESLATARGEQITKKISAISYHGANLVIRFHSANRSTHLFTVGIRSKILGDDVVAPGVSDLTLDKANTLKLKKLIIDFRDGAIQPLNTDSIYK